MFGVQGVPKRAPVVPVQPWMPLVGECGNSKAPTAAKVEGKKVSKMRPGAAKNARSVQFLSHYITNFHFIQDTCVVCDG